MISSTPSSLQATVGAQLYPERSRGNAAPHLGTVSNSVARPLWSAAVSRRFHGVSVPTDLCACVASNPTCCHPEVPAHSSRAEGPQRLHLQAVMCPPPVAAADFRGRLWTRRFARVASNPTCCHPEVPAHFSRAEGSQPPCSQPTLRALCATSVLNPRAFSSPCPRLAPSAPSALKFFRLFLSHA
jgi:hypothetical protein